MDRFQRSTRSDPANVSPRYGSAFLLQRQGRLEEASSEWREILAWCEERGYALDGEWPRRELARLETEMARKRR